MDKYPSNSAMKAAVELEIHNALGQVQTVVIGQMIQKVIDATIEDCAQTAMSSVPMFAMGLVDASEFCDFVQDTIVADIRGMKDSQSPQGSEEANG